MANQWFKFYGGEFLSDPKISNLSAAQRSVWVTLLCMASVSSTPGKVEFLSTETLLEKSGVRFNPYDTTEWDKSLGILEIFERMRMITRDDLGTIKIRNWEKRQETALTQAERAKSYRDRKKDRHENVTGHVTNVTQEENRIDKNRYLEISKEISDTSSSEIREVRETPDSEKKQRTPKKYPHSIQVFSWFPKPQKHWSINVTELQHAELLFERGEKSVRAALDFIEEQKDNEKFLWKVRKPSDLERKWQPILEFKNENGL